MSEGVCMSIPPRLKRTDRSFRRRDKRESIGLDRADYVDAPFHAVMNSWAIGHRKGPGLLRSFIENNPTMEARSCAISKHSVLKPYIHK